jgi:hypothetical protein
MRKKELIWLGALLVLGGVYIRYLTHWFERPPIGIAASIRPSLRAGEEAFPIFFTLNGDYKLTSLKVVPMAEGKFDPLAAPVWHLVSDSNSVPIRAFRYGQGIRGMKPALKGVRAEPLKPGLVYRLMLKAGNSTGDKDFQTRAIGD